MTTMAALLGALPLMLGVRRRARSCATRSASRWSGGLIVSQVLTLFTTPVIYLCVRPLARRVQRDEAAPIPERGCLRA